MLYQSVLLQLENIDEEFQVTFTLYKHIDLCMQHTVFSSGFELMLTLHLAEINISYIAI